MPRIPAVHDPGRALGRFAVPAPRCARLLHEDDLTASARHALVADGLYRPLRTGVLLRADLADDPHLRAASWERLVPARGAVALGSAVWVHAGGPPPARLDLAVPSGSRRPDPDPRRRCVEAPLPARDLCRRGGVTVTSVQRTGLDVACVLDEPEADAALHRLVGVGFDAGAALRVLSAWPRRGARRARGLLLGHRA